MKLLKVYFITLAVLQLIQHGSGTFPAGLDPTCVGHIAEKVAEIVDNALWSEWSPCTSVAGISQYRQLFCKSDKPTAEERVGLHIYETRKKTCAPVTSNEEEMACLVKAAEQVAGLFGSCSFSERTTTAQKFVCNREKIGCEGNVYIRMSESHAEPVCEAYTQINGGYSLWSDWSSVPCTTTCGANVTSVRTRFRSCTNPVPNHGGKSCSGPSFETSSFACGLNPCPVDGYVSTWSVWSSSPCSLTCGVSATKTRSRTRTCTPPQNGGKECPSPLTESQIQYCALDGCPVNGGYSLWSDWSSVPCTATCGANVTSVRTRFRSCTNPVPNHGGKSCSGPSFETSSFACGLNPCPVDGYVSTWSVWSSSPCSLTCGVSATKTRSRTRTCTPPQNGGKECPSPLTESQIQYCALDGCPVNGGYSLWSDWSSVPCTATCGANVTSVRTRFRSCTNPVPNHGGKSCSGPSFETSSFPCGRGAFPVDGYVSTWSFWSSSPCSLTCGVSATKNRTRTRTCTPPQNGGKECPSPLTESQIQYCGLDGCPVDGDYSLWSDWSLVPCTATCGANVTSVRTRFRSCTNPVPNHGGRSCSGPSFETSSFTCGLNDCPVDAVLSLWTSWNNPACPVSCGASAKKIRTRRRTCTPPRNGGKGCTGDLTEGFHVYCGLNDCPVDGGYSPWSIWTLFPCTSPCGLNATSVRARSRSCSKPVPNHGGRSCSGPSFETSSAFETEQAPCKLETSTAFLMLAHALVTNAQTDGDRTNTDSITRTFVSFI